MGNSPKTKMYFQVHSSLHCVLCGFSLAPVCRVQDFMYFENNNKKRN